MIKYAKFDEVIELIIQVTSKSWDEKSKEKEKCKICGSNYNNSTLLKHEEKEKPLRK